jgi:hypothetical protein
MEKISWIDRVRDGVLHRGKEQRNILYRVHRRKVNWIGHFFGRNCLQKHDVEGNIEGRIEVTGRRRKRRKQLLDDLKEMRWYWKLKNESTESHSVENSLWQRL